MRDLASLDRLRMLRSRADELLQFVTDDLQPFLHPFDGVTFLRTPESERKKRDVNVTTTCSCLMSLALTGNFQMYKTSPVEDAAEAFRRVVKASWRSSGLSPNNAFTTTLVLRTMGFMVKANVPGILPNELRKRWALNSARATKPRTLATIATAMDDASKFGINRYAPAAAVVYWFIDGIDRSGLVLDRESFGQFCAWSRDEFTRQLSLVFAKHESRMDPVAMAMAACLCARLRFMLEGGRIPARASQNLSNQLKVLPSKPELENAIRELVNHQRNGIWPKYFPLFHYEKAGSNFCFTFELLEAVLVEFGGPNNEVVDDPKVVAALEEAVTWCERNRLTWRGTSAKQYSGWNSGGYLETLEKGQPESWATAVVYMFLWELKTGLSERIQQRLLVKYDASRGDKSLDDFLPVEILERGKTRVLTRILRRKFVSHYRGESEYTMRKRRLKASRSALLFGPPGTSKTDVVQAVAGEIDWPLIKIDPSHFLRRSLEGIYIQADEIFDDLMDLSGAVVLFDEMDALVQTRDSDNELDTTAQFLTTFMLPKILELHDHGRVIFFMATNFQHRFDPAIKRPGRFDELLCMGPPSLTAKLRSLHKFTGDPRTSAECKAASQLLKRYCNEQPRMAAQLEFYTFSEFKSFLIGLAGGNNSLRAALEKMTSVTLADQVARDSKTVGLQLPDLKPLEKLQIVVSRLNTVARIKKLDINRDALHDAGVKREPLLVQYLIDRRQSRVTRD